MNKTISFISFGFILAVTTFVGGAYLETKGSGPVQALRKFKQQIFSTDQQSYLGPKFDKFERLVYFPGKVETRCPEQSHKTQVLLLVGQSNAANHAGQRFSSDFGDRIVNYFNGKCYKASSPLLGASGMMGESWVLLSNKMIAQGLADNVVIVTTAIGSTSISKWAKGGELNPMLSDAIDELRKDGFKVTRVVWHQGESDFIPAKTKTEDYKTMFHSVVSTMREHGIEAPIYVSIATFDESYEGWSVNNPTATAQRELPNSGSGIYKGVDTDHLVTFRDRYDGTHFSASGQEKFTNALIDIFRTEK